MAQQFPRTDLESRCEVVSAGIGMLRFLEKIVPEMAQEVEAHMGSLSISFQDFTGDGQALQSNISHDIVTSLQFQDRHAQITQDIVRMLSCYRQMLEHVSNTPDQVSAETEAQRRLMESLVLSELQKRYLSPEGEREPANEDDIELF